NQRTAAAALVGERVHSGQSLGKAGITGPGPVAVVDQQHVLHFCLPTLCRENDERAEPISTAGVSLGRTETSRRAGLRLRRWCRYPGGRRRRATTRRNRARWTRP